MSSVIGGVLQVGLRQPDPTGKHRWPPRQLHHSVGHDLLYGPYASLKAGTYPLTINGYANNVQDAWAEMFPKKDQRAFHRFDLAFSRP
jgi:hypothetical protein